MPKITPFLWFNTQAEEAVNFYVSLFPNSKITKIARYPEGAPMPAGTVMTISYVLDGAEFTAINGGPHFKMDEAVSFVIPTKDQAETDHYYGALLQGGRESACGWLEDRFGVSWQITPDRLMELISSSDKALSARVMASMMTMKKIDIAKLEEAAAAAS